MTTPRTAAKPALTRTGTEAVAIFSTEELRRAVNLWADDSYDSELASLVLAATAHVAQIVGGPVGGAVRTDYYPAFAEALELTPLVNLAPTLPVTVAYVDAAGDAQEVDGWTLDASAEPPRMIYGGDATALNALVSTAVANPVTVRYTEGAQFAPGGNAPLRQAVRLVLVELFHRGDSDLMPVIAQARRLANPYIRNLGL